MTSFFRRERKGTKYPKKNCIKIVDSLILLLSSSSDTLIAEKGAPMDADVKKNAQAYITEAKINGEHVIAIIRLILLPPLLAFAIVIMIGNVSETSLVLALTNPVFLSEILFLIIAAIVSLLTIRFTRRKQYRWWMNYILPLIDVALVTATVMTVSAPGTGLVVTGATPWLYVIFLCLCVLRNSPSSVILTGSLISVVHFVLSLVTLSTLGVLANGAVVETFVGRVGGASIRLFLDDVVYKSFILLIVTGLLTYVARRFNKMIEGQVAIRVEKEDLRNTLSRELKAVTETVNTTSTTLVANTVQFTQNIDSMVSSCGKIETAIGEETSAVEETSATITEMIHSIESVANNIVKQADLVTSSVTAIEEIGASITHITATAKKANSLATSLLTNAESGEQIMEEVSTAMQETERASKNIEEIVEIISSIASDTDLLAMNAAIEAAHAGEVGKGFAIVADEIRNLAETSGSNAKMINDILKDLSGRIGKIVELVGKTAEALLNILTDARETSGISYEVLSAMEEESKAVNEIVYSTQQLAKITEEVKMASTEQAAGGTEIIGVITHIKKQTDNVTESVREQVEKSHQIAAISKEMNEVVNKNQFVILNLNQLVKKL
jgi:methyl-accepting chemotaxis protein